MIYAGIDAGSRAIKIAVIDGCTLDVIASGVVDQGVRSDGLAWELFEGLLKEAGCNRGDVKKTVATGYSREMLSMADATITEISCHARGVRHFAPDARTIIEIGGQDSKLLRLDERGVLYDFAMNDRCAAGTGRFLEIVANRFGMDVRRLGKAAAGSTSPASINSTCVIFAETEIIGLLASGAGPEDIVAGVQESIAVRVASMAKRNVTPPAVFTGGVAMIDGMDRALESALRCPVSTVSNPQMTGAIGAALLAAESGGRGSKSR